MHLHIISFNIPFPANYGGVIDVYYKIRALNQLGVKVHLHCFEYGRPKAPELEGICESVHYYDRKLSVKYFAKLQPYIVASRQSDELLENLLKDDYPILFEGIHTCYFLTSEALKARQKIVRLHNVESDYYRALGKREANILRKIYFLTEAYKLKSFENNLVYAQLVLPISKFDSDQLSAHFKHIHYLPAFHQNEQVDVPGGIGSHCMYHGNLSVNENIKSAMYVAKVFAGLDIPLIIAGSDPSDALVHFCAKLPNVQLISNPSDEDLDRMIKQTQVHVLPAFQNTGLKLKLLHALYQGRHVLVNKNMVQGSHLEQLCHIAEDMHAMRDSIIKLMTMPLSEEEISTRTHILNAHFSNHHNALQLKKLIEKA